jgi:hypothetical protein
VDGDSLRRSPPRAALIVRVPVRRIATLRYLMVTDERSRATWASLIAKVLLCWQRVKAPRSSGLPATLPATKGGSPATPGENSYFSGGQQTRSRAAGTILNPQDFNDLDYRRGSV